MLTLHEAVVGGEDQVGVSELPFGLELGDDPLDRLVDGQQGLEPPAVAGGDLRDQAASQAVDRFTQAGLSLRSFSLKLLSTGRSAVEKTPAWRVAGWLGSWGAKNWTCM